MPEPEPHYFCKPVAVRPVRDGKASLGHDSCSGGFVFEDGKTYKADILGYDIAGNLAATTPQVEFQSPKALPHP